jgi:hypothetical protein
MHLSARPSTLAHIAPLLAALYFWAHGSLGHGLVSSVLVSRQARIFYFTLIIGQRRFHHGSPRLCNISQASRPGTAVSKADQDRQSSIQHSRRTLQGEIAYEFYGELKSGGVSLIALHGGPGIPHAYLLPLSPLLTDYGISVAVYD